MVIDPSLLLSYGGSFIEFKNKEVIFVEGSQAKYYYQLVKGKVKLTNNCDGKEFIQLLVKKGECFGELPLFDNQPYSVTAEAEKDCSALRITSGKFSKLLNENFHAHLSITRLIAERLRFKLHTIKEFAYNKPEDRILTLITYFKKSTHIQQNQITKINLTRREIAEMTGLRTETVIRIIRKLYDKGALNIIHGKIYA